jgi:hypothetical protein
MIRVDELFVMEARERQAFITGARHGHKWCHLWCDEGDEDALHAMAGRLGLKRSWFQNKPGFPHYDLVPPRREHALRLGAVNTSLREWLSARRARSEAQTPSLFPEL